MQSAVCFRRCCHLSVSSSRTSPAAAAAAAEAAAGRRRRRTRRKIQEASGPASISSSWRHRPSANKVPSSPPSATMTDRLQSPPPPSPPPPRARRKLDGRLSNREQEEEETERGRRGRRLGRPGAAVIDELRRLCRWTGKANSIPLLVALVLVVSDFLVLVALVFHLVQSSSSSPSSSSVSPLLLLSPPPPPPSPLIPSSFPVSTFQVDTHRVPLSPCGQLAASTEIGPGPGPGPGPAATGSAQLPGRSLGGPGDDESCDVVYLLSSATAKASSGGGTLISIWILDSVLLCCAVLCRLVRTSSSWLRRTRSIGEQSETAFGCAVGEAAGASSRDDNNNNNNNNKKKKTKKKKKKKKIESHGGGCGCGQSVADWSIGDRRTRKWKWDVTCFRWGRRLRPWNNMSRRRRRRGGHDLTDRLLMTDCVVGDRWGCRRRPPAFRLPWISAISQWRRRRWSSSTSDEREQQRNRKVRRLTCPVPHIRLDEDERRDERKRPTSIDQLSAVSCTGPAKSPGRRRVAAAALPVFFLSSSSTCLLVLLLLGGFSSVALSSSTAKAAGPSSSSYYASERFPTADSLNPWLAADGGLILRAVAGQTNTGAANTNASPLNWIRPNPGSCTPQPTIPACPSDRYCRLPETTAQSFPVSAAAAVNSRSPSAAAAASSSEPRSSSSISGSLADGKTRAGKPADKMVVVKSASAKVKTGVVAGEEEEKDTRDDGDDGGGLRDAVAKASQCLPYLQSRKSKPQVQSGRADENEEEEGDGGDEGDGEPSSAECICGHPDGAKRIDTLRKYHLQHCYHYSLWHVLSDTMREGIAISRQQCYAYIEAVQRLDNLAAHFVCQFEDIIRRYDCGQTFSSKSSCHQCKIAYRQWVCSMVLPMWLDGDRIKPCRTFCHEVERLCPYFLPAEKTGPGSQYAGEPSFLCIDPDVRETTNQSINSAYSERSCYRPCTLDYNLEPDIDPSLCVASLGDISGLVEEEGTTDATADGGDCQQTYKNETTSAVDSVGDGELVDDDSDASDGAYADQCQSILNKDPPLTNRVSSGAWTSHLHFGWRWRTLVLPFALLSTVTQYFT